MNTDDPTTTSEATELAQVEEAFNQAMISNDVSRIRGFITDDWVLVTPEAGIVPGSRILNVIASGELSHDTMTKEVARVKVYGDFAAVTARGQNTGQFKGQPIAADEWVTDLYQKIDGHWLCVLTHLTPVTSMPDQHNGGH
jgi:ketosteroid isomerase-like protein